MLYDVAVIGGGVIGCSLLHKLTKQGYKCVLLEKNKDLVTGASAGNAGHAHSGFDADPASLEGQLLIEARTLASSEFYKDLGVPYRRLGALLVAWNHEQLKKLPEVIKSCHLTGLHNVEQLSQSELRTLEPHLSHDALGAVIIPDEAVVDPWLLPIMLAHNAQRNGAVVHLSSEVVSCGKLPCGNWTLTTPAGQLQAKVVINAAGLYGDKMDAMTNGTRRFSIYPRQGQYAVFGKDAGPLLNHIILPLPTTRTKGIILFPTVYGNLVVGPTAEDVPERDNPTIDGATIDKLVSYAFQILPGLKNHGVVGTYAGLRPATDRRDYHIYEDSERKLITVGGIRSTGLSSSQAIAQHVSSFINKNLVPSPSQRHLQDRNSSIARTWVSDLTELIMDGVGYKVTHPITAFGLKNVAKL